MTTRYGEYLGVIIIIFYLCEPENEYSQETTKNSTDELLADNEIVVMSNYKVKKQNSRRRKSEMKSMEIASNVTRVTSKPRINEAIGLETPAPWETLSSQGRPSMMSKW